MTTEEYYPGNRLLQPDSGPIDANDDLMRQLITSRLLAPDRPGPELGPEDIEARLALRAAMYKEGVVATYPDAYSTRMVHFGEGTRRHRRSQSHYAQMVPQASWGDWNVVRSGPDIYAEPATTVVLERGAVTQRADRVIQEASAILDSSNAGTISDTTAAQSLRMLGHVPVLQAGKRRRNVIGMQHFHVAESLVDLRSMRLFTSGPAVIVHTPYGAGGINIRADVLDIPNEGRLARAQRAGRIYSVYYRPNDSQQAAGYTPDILQLPVALPKAQKRFLRRAFRGAGYLGPDSD